MNIFYGIYYMSSLQWRNVGDTNNLPHTGKYAQCQQFLPEASFGLRVLSSPMSVYLAVCLCVCVCVSIHYGNQSRGCLMRGQPLWPPAVPRLAATPSQSNPRGSGPEVVKRERGHVTSESGLWGVGVFRALQPNDFLVRTITHQPFKLESPNLTHRCKTTWLRCLWFWGVVDRELQGQI